MQWFNLSILGILLTLFYMGRHRRLLPTWRNRWREAGDVGSMFGGIMGGGGDGGDGGDPNAVQTISTLDPQQKALQNALYPYLTNQIQQGGTSYPGQYTAPMSPQEQSSLGLLSQYMNQGQPAVTTQGLQTAQQGLAGMDPATTYQQYMDYTYPQQKNFFETQTLPGVKEAYVGSGTYQGSPQMNATAKAYTDFGNQQQTAIGNAITNNRNQAYSLVPYLSQLQQTATSQPLQQAAAGQQYGALSRNLQQSDLSAQYSDWLRNNPGMESSIQSALQAMGITTQMAYQNPPNTTQAAGVSAGGNILSALISSGALNGILGGGNALNGTVGGGSSNIYTGNNFGGYNTGGGGFGWQPTTYDYGQYGVGTGGGGGW